MKRSPPALRRVAAGQLGRGDRSGVRNGDRSCRAAARKARSQDEGLCLMARTPRTFSRGGHSEAKAGENVGEGKPHGDVTEKARQAIRSAGRDLSRFSLTRSSSSFVGVLWLLRWCSARFRGWRLSDRRTWREGVPSLKHRRCNETKKISSRSAIPTRERLASRERESAWQNLRGRRVTDS